MKAANPQQTFEYVPECDRKLPVTEQTRFTLRPLKPNEESLIDNLISFSEEGTNMRLGEQNQIALSCGVVEVTNFQDANGSEVIVSRTGKKLHGIVNTLTDEFLALIPKSIRAELASEIIKGNDLGDEDAKN
tara:strand:- start:2360 stop:2755 length:396 start_codon:yes stop_codon:yes gene_type:complete